MLTFWRVAMLCFVGLSCFALVEIYRSLRTPTFYVLVDVGMACIDLPSTALFEEHLAPVRDMTDSHVRIIATGLYMAVATTLGILYWIFGAVCGRLRATKSAGRCVICGSQESQSHESV